MSKQPIAKPLLLIVDDDGELVALLAERLAQEGWQVASALTGEEGTRLLERLRPAVVVLDVMLPDASGLDLCRRWRERDPAVGILMLTGRGDPIDRILGLELGADDYLGKPFEPRELVARLRALLRRQSPAAQEAAVLRFDGLQLDLLNRQVHAQAGEVVLTTVEFKLLVALAKCAGKPMSREALNAAVQPGQYKPLDRTVDVQVARLRRKLREASGQRDWIDTVRGEGYVFLPRGGAP